MSLFVNVGVGFSGGKRGTQLIFRASGSTFAVPSRVSIGSFRRAEGQRGGVIYMVPRSGVPSADAHAVAESVQHGGVTYETGRATDVDPSDVETREDFADFLSRVLADFRSTGESEWENGTLDRFLDGLSAFAHARVVDEPESDQERASWRLFAEIVRAATGYE